MQLKQRQAVGIENGGQLRTGRQPPPRARRQLRDRSIVNGEVVIAVQSGRIQEPFEQLGALVDRQAGALAQTVRLAPHGVGGNAQCHGISTAQIDQAEGLLRGDMDVHIGIEIRRAQNEHTGIAVAAIADNGLEKRDLEGLTDIEDAKALRRVLAWIGEPA